MRIVISQWLSEPAEYDLTVLPGCSKIRQILEIGAICHPFRLPSERLGLLTMDPLCKGAYLEVLYSVDPLLITGRFYKSTQIRSYSILVDPLFLLKLPLSCPCEWPL